MKHYRLLALRIALGVLALGALCVILWSPTPAGESALPEGWTYCDEVERPPPLTFDELVASNVTSGADIGRIIRGNWAFRADSLNALLRDGDVLERCNLAQVLPYTKIGPGVTGLVFRDCNLDNCTVPPDAKFEGYSAGCQKEFCSHEHPNLVAQGLPECAEDCAHRVAGGKQWVDIPEGEFRTLNKELPGVRPAIQIQKADDADGVTQHTFRKEVYVYRDKRLSGGPKE